MSKQSKNRRVPINHELKQYGSLPFEHGMLSADLFEYLSPKDKINSLVKDGILVRLKKGLYVVSQDISGFSYDRAVIANSLYGPSYVSLETALGFYGMIPEGVLTTRSVTFKKTKQYNNEVGYFEYFKVPADYYSIGIALFETTQGNTCLMATPEKALCDVLYFLRGHRIQSKKAMKAFLFEDMRIDLSSLSEFNKEILIQIINLKRKSNTYRFLLEVLEDELCS